MGAIVPSESSELTSEPTDANVLSDVVVSSQTPDQALVDQPTVKDTYLNDNAINIDRNHAIITQLRGYATGSAINVTYFHNIASDANQSTYHMDISPSTDPVHANYLQINNFELRLREGMQFTYDPEQQISTFTGLALTYPGFTPKVGDLFIYRVEDVLGVFKINKPPVRLTISQGTSHEISFNLVYWATDDNIADITKSVREVAWFNKVRFLTEDSALLKTDEYVLLGDIEHLFDVITSLYADTFYDGVEYRSYVRPDGLYDPYMVEFLSCLMPYEYIHTIPKQLLNKVDNYNRSLYYKLLENDRVPWSRYLNKYVEDYCRYSCANGQINGLLNRKFIKIIDDESLYIAEQLHDYVTFDPQEPTAEDTLGQILKEYFATTTLVTDTLMSLVEQVYELEPLEQFYRIPVYMFLLTKIKEAITTGRGKIATEVTKPLYLNDTFVAADLVDNKLTVPHTFGDMPLPGIVVDAEGHELDSQHVQFTFATNLITIDLTGYIDDGNTVEGEFEYTFGGGITITPTS